LTPLLPQSAASFALDDVSVTFGRTRALADVSIAIAPGEALAFVGPSGAGKTTLLRLLNGAVRPTAGTVTIGGRTLRLMSKSELQRTRASIGFVHQDLRLVPNLKVIHNVAAGRLGTWSFAESLRAMLLTPRPLVHEIHEVLERVGIGDKLYERTDRLSGGQRQRVAIARALFQRPAAVIADEPVSSVDPTRARDALQLLTGLSRDTGVTLCVSLHNLELAREFFPRLVGLRHGRIAFDSATATVETAQFASLYQLGPHEVADDAG
jgi:phosphonate transport system ATP-binding protein